ncbi:MAG: LacI family DNA-binding transcriptional regulator [Propionicimonas sp.]|uniref:LacI family DNA-binding transcriptional regulator n=1 Tax=Propionicimonas sp. TaxID=1955623 RepID=UPI003D0E9BD7
MATIEDVARLAGVSTSTVSYTLSGKRAISARTKARVQKAITDLDYRPHEAARALASSRSNILGLMAPLRTAVNVNVIMEFVAGVAERAREFDYDVLLLTKDDQDAIPRVASGSMVDGLILMDIEAKDARIPIAAQVRQPVVLIGGPDDPQGLSCVDFDFEAAARLAVRRLVGAGHRRIALVGPSEQVLARGTSYAVRLHRGYRDQCASAGVPSLILPGDGDPAAAAGVVDRLFDAEPQLTGLVVHNESALPFILDALADRDPSTPVEVLAICPADLAAGYRSLTDFIDIPAHLIAQTAVDMLLDRLSGDVSPETRLIAPRLAVRN